MADHLLIITSHGAHTRYDYAFVCIHGNRRSSLVRLKDGDGDDNDDNDGVRESSRDSDAVVRMPPVCRAIQGVPRPGKIPPKSK